MKFGKIEIYVNNKLEMTCYNEFVALNNVDTLEKRHGKDAVVIKRIEAIKKGWG